jgi:hypothetical protein
MTSLGISGLPLLIVDHPLGGERAEGVARRAVQAVEQLAGLIQMGGARRAPQAPDASGRP